jgi:nucleolar protein 9
MQGILFSAVLCALIAAYAVELTFELLPQVIAADATNVMCSCYGSHVLRTLLCLCKGVPLDSLKDFHTTKRSAVLAERLSCGSSRSGDQNPTNFERGFSDMFKAFVRQMLQNAKMAFSCY